MNIQVTDIIVPSEMYEPTAISTDFDEIIILKFVV